MNLQSQSQELTNLCWRNDMVSNYIVAISINQLSLLVIQCANETFEIM